MTKINLLIISLYYPPIRSVASNRIASFARYLDRSRFNIHVMTVAAPQDAAGPEPEGVRVHRFPNRGLLRRAAFTGSTGRLLHFAKAGFNRLLSLTVLDEYRDWRDRVVKEGERLIREEGIDVVLSSYSPLACHLAALALKQAHPDLVWIADMRDEMSRNPFQPSWIRRRLAKPEQSILRTADAVTTVSRPILDDFRALASREDLALEEVRNGYDFELAGQPPTAGKRFVIAYTGTFYGSYTPYPFFHALERFFSRHAENDVSVRIVGPQKPVDLPSGIRSRVSFEPAVPHEQALAIMRQSDLLLLYHPKTERKGYYSGKLFEYLASLRPVLAAVDPASVAADLVREAKAGYVVDCGDADAIAAGIDRAYRDWQDGAVFAPDRAVIARHHRREQTRILQHLIIRLAAGRKAAPEAQAGDR